MYPSSRPILLAGLAIMVLVLAGCLAPRAPQDSDGSQRPHAPRECPDDLVGWREIRTYAWSTTSTEPASGDASLEIPNGTMRLRAHAEGSGVVASASWDVRLTSPLGHVPFRATGSQDVGITTGQGNEFGVVNKEWGPVADTYDVSWELSGHIERYTLAVERLVCAEDS